MFRTSFLLFKQSLPWGLIHVNPPYPWVPIGSARWVSWPLPLCGWSLLRRVSSGAWPTFCRAPSCWVRAWPCGPCPPCSRGWRRTLGRREKWLGDGKTMENHGTHGHFAMKMREHGDLTCEDRDVSEPVIYKVTQGC